MSKDSLKKWFSSNKNKYLLVALLAALIPLIVLLFTIAKYGVDVPYMDQWETVSDIEKFDNGTLGVGDLWRQHNEHRIFFPRIITLILAKITNWYTPAEVMASLVFSIVAFIVIFKLLQKTVTKKKYLLVVASFLTSAWYFSPIQWENWLWGWQVEWYMCIMGVVFTIYSLYMLSLGKHKNRYFTFAVLSSLLSTFSLGGGMLIWFVGLALLILMQGIAKHYKFIWGIIAGIAVLTYFTGYTKPPGHPSLSVALEQPINYLKYLLTALGAPFSGNYLVAIFAGSLLVATILVLAMYCKDIYSTHRNLLLTWTAMVAYGIGALAVTAVSRLGFGVPSATTSRYTAFSVLILVGLVGVVTLLLNEKAKGPQLAKATIAITVVSIPLLLFSYSNGKDGMSKSSALFKTLRTCTYEETPTTVCLKTTYPPSEEVTRNRIKFMKDNGYWFR